MAKDRHRPLKFKSADEVKEQIDAYFEHCDKTVVRSIYGKDGDLIETVTKPYTVAGLAAFLKCDTKTLINYEAREEFFPTIKEAKSKIEASNLERGLAGQSNAAMSIFTLKNNFGYRDQQQFDHTNKGEKFEGFQVIVVDSKDDKDNQGE